MSGIIIELSGDGLRVRWDMKAGCITLTQDGDEIDIPIEMVEETINAMQHQANTVRNNS